MKRKARPTPGGVFGQMISPIVFILIMGAGIARAQPSGLEARDRDELRCYARDTWKSVAEMAEGSELPADGLLRDPDGKWKPSRKTTMDFRFFYVPYDAADPVNHPGQIHGPYQIDRQTFGGFHQLLNTEQRIFGYIGIARGQLPAEHYYRLRRTLEPGEQARRQVPRGIVRKYGGVSVFEGHYTYRGQNIAIKGAEVARLAMRTRRLSCSCEA